MMRGTTSTLPPGGKVTTTRTGRAGHDAVAAGAGWARTGTLTASTLTARTTSNPRRRTASAPCKRAGCGRHGCTGWRSGPPDSAGWCTVVSIDVPAAVYPRPWLLAAAPPATAPHCASLRIIAHHCVPLRYAARVRTHLILRSHTPSMQPYSLGPLRICLPS